MILRGNVFSKVLEMDTGITVVIPNGFKKGRDYKVVYLLHGLCGDTGSWVDNTMLPVFAADYEAIFVMPEVGRSFYTDMKYGQKFFRYVTRELPGITESVFHISVRREDTGVIGASMGGYGALKCALSRPELYGFCCAFSAGFLFLKNGLNWQRENRHTAGYRLQMGDQLITDMNSIFGEELEWKPENEILELARKVNEEDVKPVIYTCWGSEDGFREDNIRFAEVMKEMDFDFTCQEWEGSHDWYFFNEALKRSLAFIWGDNRPKGNSGTE